MGKASAIDARPKAVFKNTLAARERHARSPMPARIHARSLARRNSVKARIRFSTPKPRKTGKSGPMAWRLDSGSHRHNLHDVIRRCLLGCVVQCDLKALHRASRCKLHYQRICPHEPARKSPQANVHMCCAAPMKASHRTLRRNAKSETVEACGSCDFVFVFPPPTHQAEQLQLRLQSLL